MKQVNHYHFRRYLLLIAGIFAFGFMACQEELEKVVESKYKNGQPKLVRFLNEKDEVVRELVYYENGNLKIKGELDNGKRHGLWISYYKDGTKWSEANYKKGVQTGAYKNYYKNGNLRYKGFMKDGERAGKWTFYSPGGEVVKELSYED